MKRNKKRLGLNTKCTIHNKPSSYTVTDNVLKDTEMSVDEDNSEFTPRIIQNAGRMKKITRKIFNVREIQNSKPSVQSNNFQLDNIIYTEKKNPLAP